MKTGYKKETEQMPRAFEGDMMGGRISFEKQWKALIPLGERRWDEFEKAGLKYYFMPDFIEWQDCPDSEGYASAIDLGDKWRAERFAKSISDNQARIVGNDGQGWIVAMEFNHEPLHY